jgi:hypothetical protein
MIKKVVLSISICMAILSCIYISKKMENKSTHNKFSNNGGSYGSNRICNNRGRVFLVY